MLPKRDRVAAHLGQREIGDQRILVREGPIGEAVESDPVEHGALLMRRGEGEQGLAARRAMQRRAPPDLDAEAEGAAAAALVDVEDLVVVDRAQSATVSRRLLGQAIEHRGGGAAQVEGFPDPMRELEQPVAEPVGVVAVLVPDEPEQHQRVEHARERALAAGRWRPAGP